MIHQTNTEYAKAMSGKQPFTTSKTLSTLHFQSKEEEEEELEERFWVFF